MNRRARLDWEYFSGTYDKGLIKTVQVQLKIWWIKMGILERIPEEEKN